MKKFGFGKKSDDSADDGSNRSALFSRKKESPAPASNNPYAQAPVANDPYAQDTNKFANMSPYQQARAGLPSGPRGGGGLPGGPSPRNGNAYGAPPAPIANEQSYGGGGGQPGGGYGANKYGASGGYGSNRYDDGNSGYGGNKYSSGGVGARGPGGYGGLGRTDSTSTDDNREALFAGAQDRYGEKQRQPGMNGGNQWDSGVSGASGAAGGASGGYGEQRELTAEEQDIEDARQINQQTKQVRNESLQTLDRALAVGNQALETGRSTLARLGAQGERLQNTNRHLDAAAISNVEAEAQAKKLKTLNRSMFAVHVANPFTAGRREMERDQDTLNKGRAERQLRDEHRQDGFADNQRMEQAFKSIDGGSRKPQEKFVPNKNYLAFNDDESDAEEEKAQELAIHERMAALGGLSGQLNAMARTTGDVLVEQNKLITKISEKSDAVDDHVRLNRDRLARIK